MARDAEGNSVSNHPPRHPAYTSFACQNEQKDDDYRGYDMIAWQSHFRMYETHRLSYEFGTGNKVAQVHLINKESSQCKVKLFVYLNVKYYENNL